MSASETEALRRAARVALVRPGDVFIFSGGNAHMALSVSSDLSVTAYESFVNLAPPNLRLFLESGTEAQYRPCRARAAMMEDIKLDVAENVGDLLCDLDEGYLQDPPLQVPAPPSLRPLSRPLPPTHAAQRPSRFAYASTSRPQRHVPAALAVLRADAAIARDVVALIEG